MQELRDRSAAHIEVERRDGSITVQVDVPAPESLAVVRLRLDSTLLRGAALDRFDRRPSCRRGRSRIAARCILYRSRPLPRSC